MVAPPQFTQEFHKKYPISMWKSCKRVIGLHRQPATTWPDKKKADPITRFAPNFSDDPRCAPIKSYRGRALPTGHGTHGPSTHTPVCVFSWRLAEKADWTTDVCVMIVVTFLNFLKLSVDLTIFHTRLFEYQKCHRILKLNCWLRTSLSYCVFL